jgi:DNA polymerase-3 subunit alpha
VKISPPKNFTGLHCHSGFSTFDGLGYPAEHINFILGEAQGGDSWALTDHGHGNGLAHAYTHARKMEKSGRKYRQVYGVEFYFVPCLDEWQRDYDQHMISIKEERDAKKAEKKAAEPVIVDAEDDLEQGGHVIEDEEETKSSSKGKPEWKRYYHLVAIAKNQKGLSNLFTLVKKAYKQGFYRFPRIDYKMLSEHSEGLILSTACIGGRPSGLIYQEFPDVPFESLHPKLLDDPRACQAVLTRLENMADRFVDIVGRDNFFLELQFNKLGAQHLTNRALIELSKKTGLSLISTADSHYPDPEKWQARELYKKLGWIGSKSAEQGLPNKDSLKCELYPKNAQQMWDEFIKSHQTYDFYHGHEELVKGSIERTHDIAWDVCDGSWIDTKAKLPVHSTTSETEFQKLVNLVKKKLIEMNLHDKPEYIARAKEELEDIKYLGHSSYFLTMNDIFHLAEKRTLLGPGRGSAPGSLVNFLLGITQFDPLEYGLLWSRFLGRHRVGWPDVDTDAADRDVLIDAARQLYGDDAVIPVSNFNTLKLKSLIKDISKFYNVPFEEVNEVTGPLQEEVMPHAKDDDQEKSVYVLTHEDCMKYSEKYKLFMEKYPEVATHVETLFMQNRSIGRHAGGVIVAPAEDLEKSMPIISVRGELQTSWAEGLTIRNLEDNGFLKFDFLGLTLLKDVENCIRRILQRELGREVTFNEISAFYDKHLNCRFNKQDDPDVWKHVYQEGRFVGIFQFTNTGARNFCVEAQPTSIKDLAAITAIYRPGPLKANVHKKYVEAKKNADTIVYDHPVIEEVLGETYSLLAYQEQFMNLAVKLAGFAPGESDKLRKTLVKKSLATMGSKDSEKEAAREKFIKGAVELSGLDEQKAIALWDTIAFFSVYGFNKSHSVAYAIDSYYAAWLHTHYETDWLATILQSENTNPKGLAKAMTEIKALGYQFSRTDINLSGKEWQFSKEVNAFVPPLTAVKGVGDAAMEEIMQFRPYTSLRELLYNTDGSWKHSKMNKTAFTSLCKIEAFMSLQEMKTGEINNHKQLLQILTGEKNYDVLKKGLLGISTSQARKAKKEGRVLTPIIDVLIEKYNEEEDWTRAEKINNFVEITTSADAELVFPPDLIKILKEKNVASLHDIQPGDSGLGWFCASEIIFKKTKNGKSFYRVKAIDDDYRNGWLRVWGADNIVIEPYTIWLTDASHDKQWGFATSSWKMKKVTAFD